MTLFLVGLNHQTAPVELREQFYLSDYGVRQALDVLHFGDPPWALAECVVLSTCNRLEIYGVVDDDDAEAGRQGVTAFLSSLHAEEKARENGAPVETLADHLYVHEGDAAIRHLMRVACGLDSLILGETQILGQVGTALSQAQMGNACGPMLSHLFAAAIHAGKRARSETDISRYPVSVPRAAAQLVQDQLGNLSDVQALVIGAGEMAELAARALQMHGADSIRIITRTYPHGAALASRLGVAALDWSRLPQALAEADVVIAATGAPHTVLHAGDVSLALIERGCKPMLFVDVAVPRDIDADVAALPGITLYHIDDLQRVVDRHWTQRQAAIGQVERIIGDEQALFDEWQRSRSVVPLIVDLRRKAQNIAAAEIEQALRRLPDLEEREQDIVAQMAHRIVNKLLHSPTTVLKARAVNEGELADANAVRELFGLEESSEESSEELTEEPTAMESVVNG